VLGRKVVERIERSAFTTAVEDDPRKLPAEVPAAREIARGSEGEPGQ
jgi:hypothetical protein